MFTLFGDTHATNDLSISARGTVRARLDDPDAPVGKGVRVFGRGPGETLREAQHSEIRAGVLTATRIGPNAGAPAAAYCRTP